MQLCGMDPMDPHSIWPLDPDPDSAADPDPALFSYCWKLNFLMFSKYRYIVT